MQAGFMVGATYSTLQHTRAFNGVYYYTYLCSLYEIGNDGGLVFFRRFLKNLFLHQHTQLGQGKSTTITFIDATSKNVLLTFSDIWSIGITWSDCSLLSGCVSSSGCERLLKACKIRVEESDDDHMP